MLDLSPLWISLRAAGLATIFTFFVGIAAARWMLTYRGQGKGFIDAIFIAPLVLPPTVVGFLLLLLLGRNSPIGQILQESLNFNIIFSWEATVITATVVAFPLMYRTSLGAFEQIDASVFLAARTLGASEWRIFWQVMLPLSYRGLVAATILSFARALGEFGATLMLAGNIPGQTQTMPVAIFFAAESGDMTTALIWVLILMGISMSVIVIVNFWAESKRVQQQGKSKRKSQKRISNIDSRNLSEEDLIIPQAHGNSFSSSPELIVDIEKQLHGFTLAVKFRANHETLGLLGASGSGKSMTLRCIAGLETPDQGHISLNGRVLFDSKRKINIPSSERQIGFVFQNYALFPHLNVFENIAFGIKELPTTEQQQRIQKYIHLLELEGLEKRFPHQLSGGQQQRVALARALATDPDILIFDEALSALDTYLRGRIEQLLIKVLSGYNGVSLFVTHKLEEAYRVCRDILVLDGGEIIEAGRKEDIFEKPRTFKTAQLTECKNFSSAQIIDLKTIRALDWNCHLQVVEPIPNTLSYIGYRAHQFTFTNDPNQPNTFPCWLVTISETQHRVTLYIKLHSSPDNNKSYDLLVEVFREKWDKLKDQPFPWYITLDPWKLILLED
ncbi:molybdate ABC transporter, inner membrane subunit [Gloeothece citriformis PCC 7424]|uniref:Molybdate ABC transporter, inner membrane subunit n=1 Tax=Gloeothece citriformis (strain PCC 7424) TaxID=65393 RepID=B7KFL9_GLOC7|nr:molybdate ABC transporter permease subunit [Gloeothece citriformis]ACK73344.1 molybdate ABC transporter, inner membrane subunit [Gloeothece citriformis PCC 7424]